MICWDILNKLYWTTIFTLTSALDPTCWWSCLYGLPHEWLPRVKMGCILPHKLPLTHQESMGISTFVKTEACCISSMLHWDRAFWGYDAFNYVLPKLKSGCFTTNGKEIKCQIMWAWPFLIWQVRSMSYVVVIRLTYFLVYMGVENNLWRLWR